MPSDAPESPAPLPASRDELIAAIARSHLGGASGESEVAGSALAARSRLPRVIAENLGAGLGQWAFFPEAAEIVDFACGYVPPSTEEDLWAIARAWASDDAAARHTMMALTGREILQIELRRIDVPKLRELFDERRPSRALVLRRSLGLDVPAARSGAAGVARKAPPVAAKPSPSPPWEGPSRMPKPARVQPKKRDAEPPPKRFEHPKFGVGVLERADGAGPEAKLTIRFASGSKALLARYVTEIFDA